MGGAVAPSRSTAAPLATLSWFTMEVVELSKLTTRPSLTAIIDGHSFESATIGYVTTRFLPLSTANPNDYAREVPHSLSRFSSHIAKPVTAPCVG